MVFKKSLENKSAICLLNNTLLISFHLSSAVPYIISIRLGKDHGAFLPQWSVKFIPLSLNADITADKKLSRLIMFWFSIHGIPSTSRIQVTGNFVKASVPSEP